MVVRKVKESASVPYQARQMSRNKPKGTSRVVMFEHWGLKHALNETLGNLGERDTHTARRHIGLPRFRPP